MSKQPWSRRRFLRAAGISGAASTLVPMLPTFGEAQEASKKRLLLLTTPNGTNMPMHRPRHGDGSRAAHGTRLDELSSFVLERLIAEHADKLTIIEGLDMKAYYNNLTAKNNSGHYAAASLYTGNSGRGAPTGEADEARFPGSASVDQIIAGHIATEPGHESRVHSLAMKVDAGSPMPPSTKGVYSFREDGTPIISAHDPRSVFAELFGDYDVDGGVSAEAERRRRRDSRIVGLHRGEFTRLRTQIPSEDHDRFDAHIESFDVLERSIHGGAISCSIPAAPERPGSYQELLAAQTSLVKHAFACDRTRVVQLSLANEGEGNMTWDGWRDIEGYSANHHTHSHLTRGDDAAGVDAAYNIAVASRGWADHIAQLITELSVENAAGTSLMDDTVIAWMMPMSHGGHHAANGTIAMVAQGKNGPFNTNQFLHFGSVELAESGAGYCSGAPDDFRGTSCTWDIGVPHNQLLVSLLQGFGVEQDQIGDPSIEAGALRGLLR